MFILDTVSHLPLRKYSLNFSSFHFTDNQSTDTFIPSSKCMSCIQFFTKAQEISNLHMLRRAMTGEWERENVKYKTFEFHLLQIYACRVYVHILATAEKNKVSCC